MDLTEENLEPLDPLEKLEPLEDLENLQPLENLEPLEPLPSASSSSDSSSESSSESVSSLGSILDENNEAYGTLLRQRVRFPKERQKYEHNYIVVRSGLSEETHLLLREIRRQRIIFEDRAADRVCSKTRVAHMISILKTHGINMIRTAGQNIESVTRSKNYFLPVRNLTNCLKELRFLEDQHGTDLWILQFMVLHNLILDMNPALSVDLFRSSIVHAYMGCADAINKRNWPMIAKFISDIKFSFSIQKKNRRGVPYSRIRTKETLLKINRNTNFISFYMVGFFLASVQRHLQLSESPDLTLGLIDDTINSFSKTCDIRKSLWVNPSSSFVLHGIIYKVCHGFYSNVTQITDAPLLQTNPDWQRIFFVYNLVADYEIFCSDKSPSDAERLLRSAEGQIESLQHREHTLIFLPIFVELCVYLSEGELLFDKLSELCSEAPVLLTHICRILIANGCPDAPLSLFESIVTAKTDSLSQFDITPSLLKVYSESPAKYGPINEIVKTNLQMAFKMLDYGRNRNNVDAWSSLHMNLKYIETESEIISQFWDSRKTWWPQLHSSITNRECQKLKKKCYKRLDAL